MSARALKGRGLYFGHFIGGHYGHFSTEGLSTFWVFEDHPATGFHYFVFHPFSFGVAVTAYARNCLERFGIPAEKIVFDVSSVETVLTKALGPTSSPYSPHFPRNLKNATQIAYLAARPAVGFWAEGSSHGGEGTSDNEGKSTT